MLMAGKIDFFRTALLLRQFFAISYNCTAENIAFVKIHISVLSVCIYSLHLCVSRS